MTEILVRCSFPDVDLATADDLCADLSDSLDRSVPEVSTDRVRQNELNQDLGTVLTIVLTSPTVGLVVRELSRWAARRHDAALRLSRTDTEATIEIKGPLSQRHERMVRMFLDGDDRA